MYKFYGQSEQDKFIFERYFKDKKHGISIECGAFDGVMESSTFFFEETMGWSCINIEASPPIFEMLKSNRKNSFNFNLGLGNEETTLSFKHAIHPHHGIKFGNGSFSHKPQHEHLLNHEGCQFEEYNVKSTRYDNVIDELMNTHFPNQIIDLFDANVVNEKLLPFLSNLFSLKLKSNDPYLWRRQIKRAMPIFKKKGTISGLIESLDQSGIKFINYTIKFE